MGRVYQLFLPTFLTFPTSEEDTPLASLSFTYSYHSNLPVDQRCTKAERYLRCSLYGSPKFLTLEREGETGFRDRPATTGSLSKKIEMFCMSHDSAIKITVTHYSILLQGALIN